MNADINNFTAKEMGPFLAFLIFSILQVDRKAKKQARTLLHQNLHTPIPDQSYSTNYVYPNQFP